jgi:hygromycin-B 7''-O-kinase
VARTALPRPDFADVTQYGARLCDAEFWEPYIREVLLRHGLPPVAPCSATAGTFPTFVVGDYVIKLFGEMFSGAQRFEIEHSAHRLLSLHPAILAPDLVVHGYVLEQDWRWPYLVTTRLNAPTWGRASLRYDEQEHLARQLGAAVRNIHELPVPREPPWKRDVLADLRLECVERHRRWRTLPSHLIDQIEHFLIAPSSIRRFVHADLHMDHIFFYYTSLVGIIDWGNAVATDPYYELPALHLHTFQGDTHLLDEFFDGYGWDRPPDFARRAMSVTLLHEFNVLRGVSRSMDLASVASLRSLAAILWSSSNRILSISETRTKRRQSTATFRLVSLPRGEPSAAVVPSARRYSGGRRCRP